MKRPLLLVGLALVLLHPVTSRGFDLSLLGGLDVGMESISPPTTGTTDSLGLGYAGGLLLHFPFGAKSHFGIEVGGLYLTHSGTETFTGDTGSVKFTFPYAVLPVMLSYNFSRHVSIRAGGYYAIAIGNITTSSTDPNVASGSQTFSQGTVATTDYGIVGGLGVDLGGPKFGFRIDALCVMGLANVDTSSTPTDKYLDFLLMAGLRITL